VNVDQPLGVGLNQRLGHNPHPTGHDHQVDLGRLEAGHQRLIQLEEPPWDGQEPDVDRPSPGQETWDDWNDSDLPPPRRRQQDDPWI